MARLGKLCLLMLLVMSVAAAHRITPKNSAFQRARSTQTAKELSSVLPRQGRISARAADAAAPIAFLTASNPIAENGSVTINATFANWAPTPDDYITISCGPTVGLDDFLDSVLILGQATGAVSVTFTDLPYLRCNYVFVYVGVTYYPNIVNTAIGDLTVPSVDSPSTPKQSHISLTTQPSSMVVRWISGSRSPPPQVRYGLEAGVYSLTQSGTSWTYTASDMCHEPANQTAQQWFRDPGFVHQVILTGLQADTGYFYEFGSTAGWSEALSFRTAPAAARGVVFAAYGDHDRQEAAHNTTALVLRDVLHNNLEFVVHIGDLGYAWGNHWVWDMWGALISPVSSRVPYMVSVGNHEYDYNVGRIHDPSAVTGPGDGGFVPEWWNNGATASNGECGVPTFQRFAAPANGNSIFWYSFEYGNVHMIQISSEHNFTRGSEMWNWLQRDLAAVDRTRTPWVVVTSHRPLYSTQLCETGDYVVSLHMREALDPLFNKYQVNLALVAHTHSYERTCAISTDAECASPGQGGTVHVTVGSAGAALEECGFSPAYGEFSRAAINTWGWLRVTTSAANMQLEFVLDSDGSVWDRYTLLPWGQQQQ